MKLMTTSLTTLAAFGIVAVASVAASACDFHKSHVTAAAPAPASDDGATAPASAIDPIRLADAQAVLVPVAPREEPVAETEE